MRRRHGTGWQVLDAAGERVTDAETLARVKALVIPPAWNHVWICPDPRGHVQATGMDARGRRQYVYHPDWHLQRARAKFDDMLSFARVLPILRERIAEDLEQPPLSSQQVLAVTVRLLDRGFFRIGSEGYAAENGTYGLATMHKKHVQVIEDAVLFDFTAKHGLRRVQHVVDPVSAGVVARLKKRRGGSPELLAFKQGGRWLDVRSEHINAYLKDRTGLDVSAKDFRTWNATVLASIALSVTGAAKETKTARRRLEVRAVKEVAQYLGNTPAVARSSYIDPRVFDRFRSGLTIGTALEEGLALTDGPPHPTQGPYADGVETAVLELIDSREGAPALGGELLAA
ncbi:MAG: DNA topoisomerase IB [Actinomycetota bacterium]|nr:DNA topoisomerase IB [Actinomycetota bacterium]